MQVKTLFFVLILLCFSCEKEDIVEFNCTTDKVSEAQMIPFSNQELGCKSYLDLYTFEGEEYYTIGNLCMDIEAIYTNCNGDMICKEDNKRCRRFNKDAEYFGIVGIAP